jgi:hypothetical protein
MSSGYLGADATGTLPVQFCQKCGQALGTSWSIEGGLNFHPWCAPSYTQGVNAKTEMELLARIAELEADALNASNVADDAIQRLWRAEAALADIELRYVTEIDEHNETKDRLARYGETISSLESDYSGALAALADLQRIIGKQEQELVEADLKLREAEAEVARLRADGCGGDPYCDCYVPPARAGEGSES